MELSEAKKECKDLIEEYLSCSVIGLDMQVDVSFGQKRCEAIDTILKALDNSISKDKVRKKIDELELLKKALPIRTEIPRFIDYLKELLGE